MTGAQAVREVLVEALSGKGRVLGEALELSPATRGLLARFPDRVHLLPAADATLVGLAVGMALGGDRPVVELAGPEALWGAIQQLGQEAARLRGEFCAPVVVRVPIAPEEGDGARLLTAIEGLCVVAASGPGELACLLRAALEAEGPVVILEPRTALSAWGPAVDDLPLGRARVVLEGRDATALAWGDGVGVALRVAETLEAEGIALEVLDLRCLAPLDTEAIRSSVYKTGRPVVVGDAAQVLLAAVREGFLRLESPPVRVEAREADLAEAVRAAVAF